MPSKSKAQQRFMGMVHALNKGEMKPSDASPAVKKAAKSMDTKSSKKYASSTHKGKPEKVKKEWLVKTIKELTNTEMEACGYTTSAVDPKYKLKSPGGTGQEDKQLKEAYGLDEMKMALIDKEIKKKIKAVARKDRNAGIQLMNLYKKHWIEFMLKAKDLLSKESLSLVNPIRMKKQTKDLGEGTINEVAHYKQFVKYMNDFYGPKGIYPDKKKRTLKMKDIGLAYSVLLKKKPDFEIGYDSTDREMLRDILIKMKKLDPDYSKKESVNEAVNPKVKKQAAALLKRYANNWKKLEKETEMMLKFAKKNKANEMAFNFEEVLKKLKGNVWSYISFQVKEPMDDYFYESINEGKGVEKIMKMANDQSFGKLAGRTVDGMTANLFKQVYDKAPQNAKDKIDKMNEKQLYVFMGKLWSKFGRQVSLR
ncbi:MAG: hypothetical protein CMD25_07015 [Flavobacteriales bacterium]|nr:hypothetical protein [Flavobacteriales bacterium]